ncbi:SMI1/KNR4 family protein [Lysobacter silvisoli]|uniref:SMI1/KNR4 family protein n=1 Tax=Lysobacter silvisoli TaxID=2293254 RepID=A0A371K178_9GAMM|nr:SMI1/KNR4 family protein [Lysobacter silvisoli]
MAPVQAWFGAAFSAPVLAALVAQGDRFLDDRIRLYAPDELIERNATYESRDYCPGYLAIGDDSGGRAIMIDPRLPDPPVYVVDHGAMTADAFEALAPALSAWLHGR